MFIHKFDGRFLFCLISVFFANAVIAVPINFSGNLDVIQIDSGGAIYSGVPLGTVFTGVIDDETFGGSITDGSIVTGVSCCDLAADGLTVFDDTTPIIDEDGLPDPDHAILEAADATLLNSLLGFSRFSAGDTIDSINIEGDSLTANGGRVEVGLSYIFAPDTFSNDSLSNYPFDANDALLSLFFILEENDAGDIYSAIGQLAVGQPQPQPVPLPAAVWLFISALLGLFATKKRC